MGDDTQAINAWTELEAAYKLTQNQVNGFLSEASVVGASMIKDVPTRVEYMRMIRAEAEAALDEARSGKTAAQTIFNRMFERRNDLRLLQQDRAAATTNIISKLITKDRSKFDLLMKAARQLSKDGEISLRIADGVNDVDALKKVMASDDFDKVLVKAIENAGGSRKTITPGNMKLRGAGLLILTVALAGLDIYMSQDKNFATSKNASSIVGGAGGAWAFAAGGLAVGGPVGGAIGLIVGGLVGSYAGEEIHFHARGIHVNPKIDKLVQQHNGWTDFDEDGLARSAHKELLGDFGSVYLLFFNLQEKRNADSDDVAYTYIAIAKKVVDKYPDGALSDAFASDAGQALVDLLYNILDGGWTTDGEYAQMSWLKGRKKAK